MLLSIFFTVGKAEQDIYMQANAQYLNQRPQQARMVANPSGAYSAFLTKVDGVFLFILLGIFSLPLATKGLAQEIERKEELREQKNQPSPQQLMNLNVYATEKKVAVLPLYNDSGEPIFNHLSITFAEILASRLMNIGYLPGQPPRKVWQITASVFSQVNLQKNVLKKSPPEKIILRVNNYRLPSPRLKKLKQSNALLIADELQSDYLLSGRLSYKNKAKEILRYELLLSDALNNIHYTFTANVKRSRPYSAMNELIEKFRDVFLGTAKAQISIDCSTPQSMAYLDDIYLGRIPLRKELLAGNYVLRVVNRKRKTVSRTVSIEAGRNKHYYIKNDDSRNRAHLEINSQPMGAAVYLDVEYLGKTPLQMQNLSEGTHRVRLVKEGYIDRFVGVELKANKTSNLNLNMKKGDTTSYYRNPQYVIGSIDNYDMAFYSALATIGAYTSWIFFNERANYFDNQRERDPSDAVKANRAKERARTSSIVGGVLSLTTAYFFYRGISLSHSREFGEVLANAAHKRKQKPEALFSITSPGYFAGLEMHFSSRY